jgi:hypothetical protein
VGGDDRLLGRGGWSLTVLGHEIGDTRLIGWRFVRAPYSESESARVRDRRAVASSSGG